MQQKRESMLKRLGKPYTVTTRPKPNSTIVSLIDFFTQEFMRKGYAGLPVYMADMEPVEPSDDVLTMKCSMHTPINQMTTNRTSTK